MTLLGREGGRDRGGTIDTELFATARRVLPGGAFGNFVGEVNIREGKGGRVWDEAGKEYVDYLLGSGPMLVGHAHLEVTADAQAQIATETNVFRQPARHRMAARDQGIARIARPQPTGLLFLRFGSPVGSVVSVSTSSDRPAPPAP
jgi:4-aminobutyrate aminotransferase-like enzyme